MIIPRMILLFSSFLGFFFQNIIQNTKTSQTNHLIINIDIMQGSIAITGGGIAGLTTAIALQQIGLHPVIFEAAPVIREIGAGIGLGANAFKALHYLGIDQEIIEAGRDLS